MDAYKVSKLNDIKKSLYKEKPVAKFEYIRKGKAYYTTWASYENESIDTRITFEIPVNDMGDADFLPEMDAKLLIRWIML
jgi:hypothetical protein